MQDLLLQLLAVKHHHPAAAAAAIQAPQTLPNRLYSAPPAPADLQDLQHCPLPPFRLPLPRHLLHQHHLVPLLLLLLHVACCCWEVLQCQAC
jgi:hypothetical protein